MRRSSIGGTNSAITRSEITVMLASVAGRIGDEAAGDTTAQTIQTQADSTEQTLTLPTDQTTTAEGDTSGQTEQADAETAQA